MAAEDKIVISHVLSSWQILRVSFVIPSNNLKKLNGVISVFWLVACDGRK